MGDHGPGKIQGPASRIGHHLYPAGIARQRRIQRRGGGADIVPLLHPPQRPGQRLARHERLVALDVHDGVERGKLGAVGHLGNPVGAGLVPAIGKDRPNAGALDHLHHPG